MATKLSKLNQDELKKISSDLSHQDQEYDILLVEDNPGDVRLVFEMLSSYGRKVRLESVSSLSAAIDYLDAKKYDVILLDLTLPDSSGLGTLHKVKESASDTAIVVLTGLDDEMVGDSAVQMGAQSYLVKGQFDEQIIMRILRHAIERQRLVSHLVSEVSLRCELQQALEVSNRDLEKRIAERTKELRAVNRTLSMLSRCNRAMLYAVTEEQLLEDVSQLIVDTGAYPLVWVGMLNDSDKTDLQLKACASDVPEFKQALQTQWNDGICQSGPAQAALIRGEYIIQAVNNIHGPVEPWRRILLTYDFTGLIVLPLYISEEKSGVLAIYSRERDVSTKNDIDLLQEMAADLSFGLTAMRISKARRRERAELVKFSTALQQTDDIVIITNKDGVIEYVNSAFERVTGFKNTEANGQTPGSLIGVDSSARGDYSEMWDLLMKGEPYRGTFVNRKKDGDVFYEQKTITPIKDDSGEIGYFLSTGKDITNDLNMQERLRKLLNYDVLTELPNRNLFLDRLEQLYEQAQWENRQLAIAIVNIDRFKNINSSLGHKVGDETLRILAIRIRDYFRPVDVVARLVGNTFAIILAEQLDEDDAVSYIRGFFEYISHPIFVFGDEIVVSTCVGVAISSHDCQDAQQLLRNAEAAMYQAKMRGPNQIEFYNKAINERSVKMLELETALRHALDRDEYILHYQPKIEITTGQVIGVEALIRWQHPQLGLIPPDEFIPLLEQTGLIVPVGQWVLEESCRQLKAWDEQGLTTLKVALNLSPRQFLHNTLIDDFSSFIAEHGIASVVGRLELEITESSFMHDLEHGIHTLKKLKDLGLNIAIDDFGTGYSSLSYLSRLPADVLKIDRSFIKNIPLRVDDVEVVRAIVALARSLSLLVVAEGVENAEQHEFLLKSGCELAQGYYYSAPQPAAKITPYLLSSIMK